jgi:hypothetical protein
VWGAVAPDRSPHPFREGTEMPTIITVSDLRTLLGVSVSLYPDSVLADIIDAAEQVTLPMLVKYHSAIDAVELSGNVATYHVLGTNNFSKGQSVIITGVGAPFNGTFTILSSNAFDQDVTFYEANSSLYVDGMYTAARPFFTVAITNADVSPRKVIPSGTATLSGASTYVGNPVVEQAVTALSKEIFQARNSSGGAIQGVDFNISPFALGRSLFNRVSGMLGGLLDVETMVG